MELVHTSGTLKIDFPTNYNVGTTDGADPTGNNMMTVTAGETVKIKVHSASLTDQTVLIDYLFDTASLGQGKYFVYDPTIKESKTVAKTVAPSPSVTSSEGENEAPSPSVTSSEGEYDVSETNAGSFASVSALAVGAAVSVVAVFLGSV